MEYVKLRNYVELISGRDLTKAQYNDKNNGIPYIMGASNMTNGKLNIERWTNEPTVIGLKADLIISVKGTVGELLILEEEKVHLSRQVMAIRPKEGYNVKFMFYYMKYYLDRLKEKAKGMIPGVTREDILDAEFIEVSSEEQQRIIKILNKAQELIDKRKAQIESLDELVKSQFIEMFGNVNTNSKGWNLTAMNTLIDVIGGYAFKSTDFIDEGVPVLKIGNINAGYFKPTNLMFWQKDEKLDRYLIKPGDLVISLTGTVGKDDYGNVCIMGDYYEEYYLNQRNAKLEIKSGKTFNKYYLTYLLKVPEIKQRLTGISRGVRQANISNKDILSLEVPNPPIELQRQFESIVNQVDKLKFEMQNSLKELEDNFDSLMQRAFKGELFK
ncbi:restriction endonuclease subunit S [Clostridium botulinum]|nr:restriction endonuclease subunit S [Clostridium botulinum]NFO92195.1 restriction endonuclease subunit S [Clostridium botulinum]